MAEVAAPDRFLVHAKVVDNVPVIEVVDNLACAGMTFELTVALQIAANMTMAASSLIAMAQESAKRQRQGIVKASGQPVRTTT